MGHWQRSQYSMVVWHGLTSEDRRNVSGSSGRIPQSCATRSLHWQESATFFSMRTAALRLCLIALLCLFQFCLPLLSFSLFSFSSVWLQVCSPLLFSSFTSFHLLFFLLALSVSISLMYLLVNIYKYIFGVLLWLMFFPLFLPSFICPRALFACVFRLQIFMPLGIYTPKSLFCHCRLAYPFSNTFSCPFLCWVCLTLSVFLRGTSSSVLQVLSKGQSGSSGAWYKKDTHIYILCLLVNMTLACLLLMHCCSMHTVPGGAGHVWFIRCVPTHRPRAFMPAICILERRSLQSLTSSLADSRGDRQSPRYRSVYADGRCGNLTQSEPRTHANWIEAHFSSFTQM